MNTSKRPNILWFCTDQQRLDTINALGNPDINTPNLDRLVKEGVAFKNAYTQSPLCTPSRASFLTGRYPRTTRATANGIAYFPGDEVLVTKIMADNGYDCGLVGKLHLSAAQKAQTEDRQDDGYRVYKWSQDPFPKWEKGHAYHDWLDEEGVNWTESYKGRKGGIETKYHQTTWCVNEGIKFIEENREGPWLLSINTYDPHVPFDPPQEYKDRYKAADMKAPKWKEGEMENRPYHIRKDYIYGNVESDGAVSGMTDLQKKEYISDYYSMVELVDAQFGRLLDALEKTGQRENTVVIFHSDHGEMLGDHGLIVKGAYFYEELVNIPLIFSWPGYIVQGLQSNALVELVDLAETILEFADIEIPYYMQGKSLAPLLTGKVYPHKHKDHVYCEYYAASPVLHPDIYATMYFDGRYKLVTYHNCEDGELYDFKYDPGEFENLWNRPELKDLKMGLLKSSFDASVMTIDPKPPKLYYY